MKYKIVFFIVVFISASSSLFGQYNYEWAKKAQAKSLDASVTDEAGNTYVTGKFVNGSFGPYTLNAVSGFTDVFIAKYNNAGNCVWAKRCGGVENDFGFGITLDKDQNCIVVGEISGSGTDADFGVHTVSMFGQADIFVTKLDSAGNFLWAKGAGGTFDDVAEAVDVDDAGNIYVGGRVTPGAMFGGVSAPTQGAFLAKYNSSGICQWVRNNNTNSIDNIYGITTDSAGNSLVTGVFTTTATFGSFSLTSAGDGDIFMARYNNAGTCLMAKRIGGIGTDSGMAITEDSLGNFYVAGYFDETVSFGCASFGNGSTGFETYVAKYDYNGNCKWVNRTRGGNGNWPLAIQLDRFGYVYVTGWFRNSIEMDSITKTSAGAEDIYLAKLNPYGKCASLIKFGDTSPDQGTGLGIDSSDNLYLAGFFQRSVDFNPSATVTNFLHSSSTTSPDVFIAKYALCPPVFHQQDTSHCGSDIFEFPDGLFGGGSSTHTSYLVSMDDCDSIINTVLDFIPINTNVNIETDTLVALDSTASYQWFDCLDMNGFFEISGANSQYFHPDSSGYYSVEIISDGCVDTSYCYFISLTGMGEKDTKNTLNVFPNPASDKLFFEDFDEIFSHYEFLDMNGKVVSNGVIDKKELKEIPISDIVNGLYILKLSNEAGLYESIPIIINK